jgi:hypothetical protein
MGVSSVQYHMSPIMDMLKPPGPYIGHRVVKLGLILDKRRSFTDYDNHPGCWPYIALSTVKSGLIPSLTQLPWVLSSLMTTVLGFIIGMPRLGLISGTKLSHKP